MPRPHLSGNHIFTPSFQAEQVAPRQLERLDLNDGFSVFSDRKSTPTYQVVFVHSSTAVFKTTDQNQAERHQHLLNRFKGVAKNAGRFPGSGPCSHLSCLADNHMLERCVQTIFAHPQWTEMHVACALGLPDYVDALFRQYDPLS